MLLLHPTFAPSSSLCQKSQLARVFWATAKRFAEPLFGRRSRVLLTSEQCNWLRVEPLRLEVRSLLQTLSLLRHGLYLQILHLSYVSPAVLRAVKSQPRS